MAMLISFTFNPSRESDFHMSIALAKEHFPGAFKQGYHPHQINQRGVRITCTSEEFCRWIYERDQMGFVNRMHQLHLAIGYTPNHHHQHFPTQQEQQSQPPRLEPLEYSTPAARSL